MPACPLPPQPFAVESFRIDWDENQDKEGMPPNQQYLTDESEEEQ